VDNLILLIYEKGIIKLGYFNILKFMLNQIAKWLVIIGALNWGLVGIGYFANTNLNLVNRLLGSIPTLEAIVYILVGVSAVLMLMKK
jgi:uncharacterized membrane protein YuzA (DUF378 family)